MFVDYWWHFIIFIIASYFLGNIHFARIISALKKGDITKQGSGNPGTMNMLRQYGITLGVLTLIFDAVKGLVPTLIAYLIYKDINITGFCLGDLMAYVAGFSAVIGHIYPVIFKFKGGKGVATTIGVFFAMNPLLSLILFIVLILYILFFEYGSTGSFIFITGMGIGEGIKFYLKYIQGGIDPINVLPVFCLNLLIFLITIFTWFAHRANIVRLCAGTEHRTSLMKLLKGKKKPKDNLKNKDLDEKDKLIEERK